MTTIPFELKLLCRCWTHNTVIYNVGDQVTCCNNYLLMLIKCFLNTHFRLPRCKLLLRIYCLSPAAPRTIWHAPRQWCRLERAWQRARSASMTYVSDHTHVLWLSSAVVAGKNSIVARRLKSVAEALQKQQAGSWVNVRASSRSRRFSWTIQC